MSNLTGKIARRLLRRGGMSDRSAPRGAPPPPNEATLKHVAICGVSYCGSTLFARVLGSLPGVANIGESHWLADRREGGVTVAADPTWEAWETQVHCARCGPNCEVLTREFRIGLLADRTHWYHKIAQQLDTGTLISSDKNCDRIVALEPSLRLDAVVLFKSPPQAAFSHFRNHHRKGHPEAPGGEVSKYLTQWARSHETFLDRFEVRGKKIFLSWARFCEDPHGHLERLCALLSLPFDCRVLERIDPEQHCLGGNRLVNQHFRQGADVRVHPLSRPTLPAEYEEAVERHDRSGTVHGRLLEMHRGAFEAMES